MLLEILYRLVFLYGCFNITMFVIAKVAPDLFMRILSWFVGGKVSLSVSDTEQEHDPLDPVVGCKCEKCQPLVATPLAPIDGGEAHSVESPLEGCECFDCHPGKVLQTCECHPDRGPQANTYREMVRQSEQRR